MLLPVVQSISDGGVGEDVRIPEERERGECGLTRRWLAAAGFPTRREHFGTD